MMPSEPLTPERVDEVIQHAEQVLRELESVVNDMVRRLRQFTEARREEERGERT